MLEISERSLAQAFPYASHKSVHQTKIIGIFSLGPNRANLALNNLFYACINVLEHCLASNVPVHFFILPALFLGHLKSASTLFDDLILFLFTQAHSKLFTLSQWILAFCAHEAIVILLLRIRGKVGLAWRLHVLLFVCLYHFRANLFFYSN